MSIKTKLYNFQQRFSNFWAELIDVFKPKKDTPLSLPYNPQPTTTSNDIHVIDVRIKRVTIKKMNN